MRNNKGKGDNSGRQTQLLICIASKKDSFQTKKVSKHEKATLTIAVVVGVVVDDVEAVVVVAVDAVVAIQMSQHD